MRTPARLAASVAASAAAFAVALALAWFAFPVVWGWLTHLWALALGLLT